MVVCKCKRWGNTEEVLVKRFVYVERIWESSLKNIQSAKRKEQN